ncbi:unnamed protein product [Echinostoma caproni]|uniref:Secreted protein n=1 Tax=Echinostoma caproni TaxID=27848 RepID=A0A183ARP5_9TREM|nr:unnamed protein product [Echinostoma caproni]
MLTDLQSSLLQNPALAFTFMVSSTVFGTISGETSDGLKNKDDQSKPKDCDESKLTEALKSLQVDPVTGSGDQEKPTIVAAN